MPEIRQPADRERARQAALMRRLRAAGRDLTIPPVANPRRRRRCLRDPALFGHTYFPHLITRPLTISHRGIIDGVVARIRHGGCRAEAAPRGEGKTTWARILAVWALLAGLRQFIVIVSAVDEDAQRNADAIRSEFERNDLLADDYPEVCVPIAALAGANQRAAAQTVDGERTYLRWAGEYIVLPTVAGSPASGAVVTSRGITGAIRGLNYRGRRPDLIILDDPETRESAGSPLQVAEREAIVEADIMGLAGRDRQIAAFYTCTIWQRACLADRFTDPKVKPAWDGVRRRLIEQWPARQDLWERYLDLRAAGPLQADPSGRAAHALYLAERAEMDRGHLLTNPYAYDATRMPDGSEAQSSALEAAYQLICDRGWEHFRTEYQQEPAETQAADGIPLDNAGIMGRLSRTDRGLAPAGTERITAAVDIGIRAVHWCAIGWRAAAGVVLDYGALSVHSPVVGAIEAENLQATAGAIYTALCELRDLIAGGWPEADTGQALRPALVLIDAAYARGALDEPVYQFCAAAGAPFAPSKGFGSGSGQAAYRHPTKAGQGKKLYVHAFTSWQPRRHCRLWNIDADFWKRYVHDAFTAPAGRPGSLVLFGSDPGAHRHYANQITAEQWTHEYHPRKGDIFYWKRIRPPNHWLDTTANACCAAAALGTPTVAARDGTPPPAPPPAPKPQPMPAGGKAARRFSQMERAQR